VRKVLHNEDGDLLFSCSDDGKVCMYDTHQCVRTGVFDVQSACTSIDVTKDSKYLLATSVDGAFIFNVKDGTIAAKLTVPGNRKVALGLSYGDKQFFLMYVNAKITYIRIYDMAAVLSAGISSENTPKPTKEFTAATHEYTCAAWGPLNKTLYVATKTGKVQTVEVSSGRVTNEVQVHGSEIYMLTISHDFTMLFTSSRDGTSKLLHPEHFDEIRCYSFDGKACRAVAVSPLHDSQQFQKFHMLMAGGQDARDVALTGQDAGGFAIRLQSVIFGEQLAEIHGHFGPVHSLDFSPDGFAFASGGEDGYVHYHRFPPEYFTSDFE
jgi:translation initiation factor 3 subunit I